MRQVLTYHGYDIRLVEVLVPVEGPADGGADPGALVPCRWCTGELRAWRQHDDGTWSAQVVWSRGPGQPNFHDVFPADRVREYVVQGPAPEPGSPREARWVAAQRG